MIHGAPPPQIGPQSYRLRYRAAPLSVWRANKGLICLHFDVLDEEGLIALPIPDWFRRHRWARHIPQTAVTTRPDGSKGLTYIRYRTEGRGLKTYLDFVVREKVTKFLRRRGHSGFKLEVFRPL